MNLKLLSTYLITLLILIGLDTFWLGIIAKDFFKKHLGYLMRDKFLPLPALLFYLIYAAGLLYFSLYPGLQHKNLLKVIGSAAFLGLISYATFDLTSLAIIKNWSIKMTVIDILWGTFVSGLTAFLVFKLVIK